MPQAYKLCIGKEAWLRFGHVKNMFQFTLPENIAIGVICSFSTSTSLYPTFQLLSMHGIYIYLQYVRACGFVTVVFSIFSVCNIRSFL